MRARLASVLLIAPLIQACAADGTLLPATTKVLDKMPRVQNSTKAPCWLQRQIAAQNSYVDTIKAQAEAVYKAPCDVDPPKKHPAKVASAQ